jgi:hypothetical protein
MGYRIRDRAAARALVSAPVVGSIALMVTNDHFLKGSGLFPGLVTGKLSDFAFLFFAPIVLAALTRARSVAALLGCYAAPTGLFVAINVSADASAWFAATMSRLYPMVLWPDVEDLVALASAPLSWWYLSRQTHVEGRPRAFPSRLVTVAAALACLATSPVRPPTHRAIYMSWEEFRTTAVRVLPPKPIGKRGKLLVADDHLFVSEPGQGVHVFDDRDPENPVPLFFIRIPGNIDTAVRDNLLYADSAVDLLTFELRLEEKTAKLVGRLEDQFRYDPYQTLEEAQLVSVENLDRSRGVVVRLEPIAPGENQ